METEGREIKSQNVALINSFIEITSSSNEEALFFLESHDWDLDAAISTFVDSSSNPVIPVVRQPIQHSNASPSPSHSPEFPPSQSPFRSRSPSPPMSQDPYEVRSRRGPTGAGKVVDNKASSGSRARGIRTLADLSRHSQEGSGSDSDEPQEYYTGGEKSGMLVQDPTKHNDVEAIFNQARQSQAGIEPSRPSSSSKTFQGTGRLLSGETLAAAPQHPEGVTHTITFWRNGFSVDDGPLRRLDDPENAPFLESIKRSECPKELEPADRRTSVQVNLVRRDENYPEPPKHHIPFQGVGRTLGSETTSAAGPVAPEPAALATPLTTAPLPSMGLIVDNSSPTTSIQLRLADGTRMVSRFNYHHTIRDVRSFIDASRPSGARSYHLQSMGFPPKKLTELDQTIEEAGIANSVVIQKF